MKWIRWCIFALVVCGVGYGAARFYAWQKRESAAQYAQYVANQHSDDPSVRLAAIDGLLQHHDDHVLMLRRARTLLEMRQFGETRAQLHDMISARTPLVSDVFRLMVESYLLEADDLIQRTDQRDVDEMLKRVTLLMEDAAVHARTVADKSNVRVVTMLNARRHDVLSRAYEKVLDARLVTLTEARVADNHELMQRLGGELLDLRNSIQKNDTALRGLCESLLADSPNSAAALELLFHLHLRHRDLDAARKAATRLAKLETLDRQMVARVAEAMLDQETTFGEPITPRDLELAGMLLHHPRQTGTATVLTHIARAMYALYAGDAVTATEYAREGLEREQWHPRLRGLLAFCAVERGRADLGVELVMQTPDYDRSARCLYALGVAYLKTDSSANRNLGLESLRRCLKVEPNHMPARLYLIESLVSSGYVAEAADDIALAERINPDHPRVRALKTMLAVEQFDLGTIAGEINGYLSAGVHEVDAEDVLMVASLVLDDATEVATLADALEQRDPRNVFAQIARGWLRQTPLDRGRTAPVVARTLLAWMERDPLRRADRPAIPTADTLPPPASTPRRTLADVIEPLKQTYFVTRPHNAALRCVELALDRAPADSRLLTAAAKLCLWLDRPKAARAWLDRIPPGIEPAAPQPVIDAMRALIDGDNDRAAQLLLDLSASAGASTSPTRQLMELVLALRRHDLPAVTSALNRLLAAHPWAEPALLLAVIDAVRRDQLDRAFSLIGVLEVGQEAYSNPQLAQLVRARLYLGLGRPADAMIDLDNLLRHEATDSDLRRWAAEVRARAYMATGQPNQAVGAFDHLAIGLREQQLEAKLGAADLLIATDRPHGASEVLSSLLHSADNTPRQMDELFTRAFAVMERHRLAAQLDSLLALRPNEPILKMYEAILRAEKDRFSAEELFRELRQKLRDPPRLRFEWAKITQPFQPDEAARIYEELINQGGVVGRAAQRALNELNHPRVEHEAEEDSLFSPIATEGTTG